MEFKRWLEQSHSYQETVETAVQLLMLLMEEEHPDMIPENLSIRSSEGKIYQSANLPAEKEQLPPDSSSPADDKDNVFLIAVMLNSMLGGELPDMKLAGRIQLERGQSFSFLTVDTDTDEKFGRILPQIVALASDLNKYLRPAPEELLKKIMDEIPSTAEICIIEKYTGICVDSKVIPLEEAVTHWECEETYDCCGRVCVPAGSGRSLDIPYSVTDRQYTCTVIPSDLISPESNVYAGRMPDKLCIGIDPGTNSCSVSFINESCRAEELFGEDGTIPSLLCFLTGDEYCFGNEAEEYSFTHPQAVTLPFMNDPNRAEPVHLKAVNGDAVCETNQSLAEKYFRCLRRLIIEHFSLSESTFSSETQITIALSSCTGPDIRNTIASAASAAGLDAVIISAGEALMIYLRDTVNGKTVAADIGGGSTDILLTGSSQDDPWRIQPEKMISTDVFCGELLTDIISDSLADTLRKSDIVDLSDLSASQLEREEYIWDKRILRKTAEMMKCILSDNSSTSSEVSLYVPGNAVITKNFRMPRRMYETMMSRHLTKLEGLLKKEFPASEGVTDVVITGGASLTPLVTDKIEGCYPGSTLHHIRYKTAVSRGAAMYSDFESAGTPETRTHRMLYDIGIITAAMTGGSAGFQPVVRAGTVIGEEGLTVTKDIMLTDREMAQKCCKLYLHTRPVGKEDVTDPIGHGESIIRRSVLLTADGIPPGTRMLRFTFRIGTDESISAFAESCTGFGGTVTGEYRKKTTVEYRK